MLGKIAIHKTKEGYMKLKDYKKPFKYRKTCKNKGFIHPYIMLISIAWIIQIAGYIIFIRINLRATHRASESIDH